MFEMHACELGELHKGPSVVYFQTLMMSGLRWIMADLALSSLVNLKKTNMKLDQNSNIGELHKGPSIVFSEIDDE